MTSYPRVDPDIAKRPRKFGYARVKTEAEAELMCGDREPGVATPGTDTPSSPYRALSNGFTPCNLLLIVSLAANLALVIAVYGSTALAEILPYWKCALVETPYAGLVYDVNGTWEYETPFAQENVTAADEEWMGIDISEAFVALTKEHAKELGLPPSLPFPWDSQRKELYLISSIHSMHCLTVLHRSNLEYRTNHTQTYSTEHILHCLDNLRVDLECSADDTPRYIPPGATESTAKTGVGQVRKCRDWSKMKAWAKEHGACFNYNQFLHEELTENKVYPTAWQFCDKDNKYLPMVQKHYHKTSDWVAPLPEWPDIDRLKHH